MTGQGMRAFFSAVEECRQEYERSAFSFQRPWGEQKLTSREYKPELERLAAERATKSEADKKDNLSRLLKDMNVGKGGGSGNPFGPHPRNEREDRYMDEDGLGSDEEAEIRRQEEEEAQAQDEEVFDAQDMGESCCSFVCEGQLMGQVHRRLAVCQVDGRA